MRQTVKEIEVNIAYRWFLGLDFTESVPHHSTFSKNYERRFSNSTIFEDIFLEILNLVNEKGLLNKESSFIDSTHTKAYANKRKIDKKEVEVTKIRNLGKKSLKEVLDKVAELGLTFKE